jgi:GNAT superfamily N-acetyltransferase
VTGQRELAISVRAPGPDEGERLREIAIASKAHWGYDLDFVRRWAARGDFSAAGLSAGAKEVYVADMDGAAVAWAALVPRVVLMWLDDLWVDPPWIGRGVGSLLFRHAVERARRLGGSRLEWQAEPNSIGFYEKLGGCYLRDGELTSWGRVLPVMGLDL